MRFLYTAPVEGEFVELSNTLTDLFDAVTDGAESVTDGAKDGAKNVSGGATDLVTGGEDEECDEENGDDCYPALVEAPV